MLAEEAGAKVEEAPQGSLSAECAKVVQLAEPGDAFNAFTASMNASAIASSVKSIEHSLGLRVRILSYIQAPQMPPECVMILGSPNELCKHVGFGQQQE